jgi:hypothetical protein
MPPRLYAAALLVVTLGSCARLVPIKIPIQFTRITQTEEYEQVFRFRSPEGDPGLYEELERVFTKLVGKANWENVRDAHSDKMKHIRAGKVKLRGRISATMYLHPTNHKYFVLEGSGRYHMLDWERDENPEILLSGDFVIPSKCHDIQKLSESKKIVIDVMLYLSHVPAQREFLEAPGAELPTADNFLVPARYYEVKLQYELDFVPDVKDENVYLVRYRDPDGNLHPHRVLIEGEQVADMFLISANSNYKILDLRGLEYVQRDYAKVLGSSSIDSDTGCEAS